MKRSELKQIAKEIAAPVYDMVKPEDPDGYARWLDAIELRLVRLVRDQGTKVEED